MVELRRKGLPPFVRLRGFCIFQPMMRIPASGYFFAAMLCIGAASCSPRAFDLSRYKQPYLVFGQGGGITGFRSEYILLSNGNIYQRRQDDSLHRIKNAGRYFAVQMIDNYAILGLDKLDFIMPGDRYYYVERHHRGSEHRLVWGSPGFTVDHHVMQYYETLDRTIKKYTQ